MFASRPSAGPPSLAEPLVDPPGQFLHYDRQSSRNDLREGRQRVVEIAHPDGRTQVSRASFPAVNKSINSPHLPDLGLGPGPGPNKRSRYPCLSRRGGEQRNGRD
jgi:hypothetical protein